MSFLLPKDAKVDISFSPNYSKAIFGLSHIAFIKNDGSIVFPSENKQAIINSLSFYKDKVLKYNTYTFNNGETDIIVQPSDNRVLQQILGLPSIVYERIDLEKDIVSQLNFVDNLSLLKKECYSLLFKQYKRNWFTDDFKLFLINNGFYFPYDETKPFISKKKPYPIHINEKLFSTEVKNIIHCKHSQRFALDFLGKELSLDLFHKMEKLDCFSFERKIDYFINNQPDDDIESEINNDEFKLKYTNLLKLFVASLINLLYDDYSFKVLKKVTSRLSFLSIQKIHENRNIYILSGYFLEAFSYDKKNWFLSINDKERLYRQFIKTQQKIASKNPIMIFAHIGLPYILYTYVKNKTFITADDFVDSFDYEDIPFSIIFQSPKRSDLYSYITGDNKHLLITLSRELFRRGMDYSSINPFDKKNYYETSTIIIDVDKKYSDLYNLVENPNRELHKDLFQEYNLENNSSASIQLRNTLKIIDEKSNNNALYFFYHSFNNLSVYDVVKLLLSKYKIADLYSTKLLDFFFYLYSHPFDIAYLEARKSLLRASDSASLQAIEISPGTIDNYETNMPYPYVSFGKAFYSFRKNFYSMPCLPLSEKQNVILREEMLNEIANNKFKNRKNKKYLIADFIKENFGLPKNISSSIDFTKSITRQIRFKEGISHIEVNSEPTNHFSIDHDNQSAYNIFSTYIVSNAVKYGVLINKLSLGEEEFVYSMIKEIDVENYHGVVSFNYETLLPIMKNYLGKDSYTFYSLILTFFSSNFVFVSRCFELVNYVKYNISEIEKSLYKGIDDLSIIQRNFFFFIMLASVLKAAELSYAIYCAKDIIPELELSPYSLNIDYQPRLKYPYVHLGRVFNAYSESEESDEYYFCSCDKSCINGLLEKVCSIIEESCPKEIYTALALALIGLPYVVIKKYASLDLKSITPSFFTNSILKFKDGICRRCQNISHAIFKSPFIKAFPHKEDSQAEYSAANNGLAHDGMLLLPFIPLEEIKYSNNYKYNLNSYYDDHIPNIIYYGIQPPMNSYTFFCMPVTKLNDYLHEYIQYNKRIEIAALSSGIILDTYSKNKEIFFNFIFKSNDNLTLDEKITLYFPEITRSRDNMAINVKQSILGFITFLIEKFVLTYVNKEKEVGN